jgi:hypothetical protein
MGQPITVSAATVDGDIAVFDTDRSITGQDGASFGSAEDALTAGSIPGDLAGRLFASDDAITHVFIASNLVVVGRDAGWDDAALAGSTEIVSNFFVFYD